MENAEDITTILARLKNVPGPFIKRGNLIDIFDREYSYINQFHFYCHYFHRIPNFIHEFDIECEKAVKWFCTTYCNRITDHYFTKIFLKGPGRITMNEVFLVMDNDIVIQFETNESKVRFLFKNSAITVIEQMAAEIHRFKRTVQKNTPKISLLVKNNFGFDTKTLIIKKPNLNISDNYNDDFLAVHKIIKKRLNQKYDSGLVLLHGLPGTGKTSYIRYLSTIVRKKIIFLPVSAAKHIAAPEFIPFLIENANCVLIIEDAESLIADRIHNDEPSVSALLNLCDGLLSDCLNIQVICSFNIDISKVDKALIRKGRLIALYEFKELTQIKGQQLSKKLGYNTTIAKPSTLSEIYNQDHVEYAAPNMKVVGFYN